MNIQRSVIFIPRHSPWSCQRFGRFRVQAADCHRVESYHNTHEAQGKHLEPTVVLSGCVRFAHGCRIPPLPGPLPRGERGSAFRAHRELPLTVWHRAVCCFRRLNGAFPLPSRERARERGHYSVREAITANTKLMTEKLKNFSLILNSSQYQLQSWRRFGKRNHSFPLP